MLRPCEQAVLVRRSTNESWTKLWTGVRAIVGFLLLGRCCFCGLYREVLIWDVKM
jgi:hypothetical protein